MALSGGTLGVVSALNSTTTPLGAGGVFMGGIESTLNSISLTLMCAMDADGSIAVQWSQDGVNFGFIQTFATQANFVRALRLDVRAEFFRIVYTNGAVAQTVFRLQLIKQAAAGGPPTQILNAFLTEDNVGMNVRSVLAAKDAAVVTNPPLRNLTGAVLPGSIYALHVAAPQLPAALSAGGNLKVGIAEAMPLPTGAATEATLATRAAAAQLPMALTALGNLKVAIQEDPLGAHKQASAGGLAASSTAYTVTATKTLRMSSLNISVFNASLIAAGRLDVIDATAGSAGTILHSISLATASNQSASQVVLPLTMPDWIFATVGVRFVVVSGTLTYSYSLQGREV